MYMYNSTAFLLVLGIILAVLLVSATGGTVNLNVDHQPNITVGMSSHEVTWMYGTPVNTYWLYVGPGVYQHVHVYRVPGYGLCHVIVDNGVVWGLRY